MNPFQVGDRVKMSDADNPNAIPAYRALRGVVVSVHGDSSVRVHWDCDKSPDVFPRHVSTIAPAND